MANFNIDVILIDKVVAKAHFQEVQNIMHDEIETFNTRYNENFGAVFYDLGDSKKCKVLKATEKSSRKFSPRVWVAAVGAQEPIGFYRSLKSTVIWAYMTSEEIGGNVPSYDPLSGNYQACRPVSEVENKWSL